MKEIRITFKGEDFVAVSRSLIDLGVTFQVQPVEGAQAVAVPDGRAVHPSATVRSRPTKRRSSKTIARPRTAGAGAADARGNHVSGAGRLRAIVERNRRGSGEPESKAGESPLAPSKSGSASIPDDLSAKLQPYGEPKE
jgi:hypothetical protein